MKYSITESHVDKLIKIFTDFMNSETYVGVCDLLIDYDNEMDQFVINIFFERDTFGYLTGYEQRGLMLKIGNKIYKKFHDFTGFRPITYNHFKKC